MPSMKRKIFLSYAHKDDPDESGVRWLSYVLSHLRLPGTTADIEPWADENLRGGQDWEARIMAALDSCDIFVLLVSRHALTSSFIMDREVPRILRRQAESGSSEYPLLFPILITDCAQLAHVDWSRRPQLRPKNRKALSTFKLSGEGNERDPVMAAIAREIHEAAKAMGPPTKPVTQPSARAPQSTAVPPHDLDSYAVLAAGKLSIAAAGQMPPEEAPQAVTPRDLHLELIVSSPACTTICGCEVNFRIKDVRALFKVEGAALELHDLTELLKLKGHGFARFAPSLPYAAGILISSSHQEGVSGSLFPDGWARIGQLRPNGEGVSLRVTGDIVITPAQIEFLGDVAPAGKKLPANERKTYESMVKALAKRVLEKHAMESSPGLWPLDGDSK